MTASYVDISADLQREFPTLYTGPVECGAEVPAGWVGLVNELSDELEEMVTEMPVGWRPKVLQIKQKLGSLRVHCSFATVPMMTAIREAEQRSKRMCEQCGLFGSLRTGEHGWQSTLCDGCVTSR